MGKSKIMFLQKLWQIHVECIGPTVEIETIFEELFFSLSISVEKPYAAKKNWIVTALFDVVPNFEQVKSNLGRCSLVEIVSIQLNELPQKDWVEENRKVFPAFKVGRFWVYGSHIKSPLPQGLLSICVDAAQAFGSGTHATTKGCMLAIQSNSLSRRHVKRILDLGSGTGILSMAAKYIYPNASIIAADCDRISVKTTLENWQLNHFSNKGFFAVHSNGFSNTKLRSKRKFDLIIANILVKPLRVLSPLIAQNLNSNGRVIISGLLTSQVRDIRAVYRHHNLFVKRHFQIKEWSTLLLAPNTTSLKELNSNG